MKTTLIRPDGTRLVIEPSLLFGCVRLWVLGREEIINIPVALAGAAAASIEAAATYIEEACQQPEPADLPTGALTPADRFIMGGMPDAEYRP